MVAYFLKLATDYPELASISAGIVLSALIVALADAVYFPDSWSLKQCRQAAVALNVLIGTAISYGLWRFLDPGDPRWFDLWVSAVSVAGSPMLLYIVSKVLSWKFPSLDLTFGLLANRK